MAITVENRDYHYLSQSDIDGGTRIYRHLSRIETFLTILGTITPPAQTPRSALDLTKAPHTAGFTGRVRRSQGYLCGA
jgi:hypothetical protein